MPDLTNPQTLNRYSYGLNNPVKYTDPSGHAAQCPDCSGSGLWGIFKAFERGRLYSVEDLNSALYSYFKQDTYYNFAADPNLKLGDKLAAGDAQTRVIEESWHTPIETRYRMSIGEVKQLAKNARAASAELLYYGIAQDGGSSIGGLILGGLKISAGIWGLIPIAANGVLNFADSAMLNDYALWLEDVAIRDGRQGRNDDATLEFVLRVTPRTLMPDEIAVDCLDARNEFYLTAPFTVFRTADLFVGMSALFQNRAASGGK